MDFLTKGSAKQERSLQNNRWFVNVDEDMAKFQVGNDHFTFIEQKSGPFGPEMKIEATLHSNNTKKNYEADWTLDSDPNNTDPALQGSQKASLRQPTTTEEKHTVNDEVIRRFFKNWLDLPDIGGDKHTIICTKKNSFKKNRQILRLEVETWRRLWYTIFWTDDSQKALINKVADIISSAFEKAKIDLVHVPAQNKLNYAHEFCAIVSSDNDKEDFVKAMHGGQHPALQRKPFHMQVVLVKKCAKLTETKVKLKIDATSMNKLVLDKDVISGVKAQIPESRITCSDDVVEQIKKMRGVYRFDKTIRSLTYQISGQPSVTVNGPFLAKRTGVTEFVFQLSGPYKQIADAIAQGNPVDFIFEVDAVNIAVAGQNQGNKIVIQTLKPVNKEFQQQSAEEVAKTLIHEIGHALGLVPAGDFRWTHPHQYTGHGGVGRHCNYNAKLNGSDIYVHSGGGKMCVMYHELDPNAGPEFCANCMKYLKFTKLRKGVLGGYDKGWTFTS